MIWLSPSFCRKISWSLSYLVPEILGPKLGLIFKKNVLFNHFLSILYQFSPWFSIQLTPSFIELRSFWPLFFSKPYEIRLSPFFYRMLNPVTVNLVKYLPSQAMLITPSDQLWAHHSTTVFWSIESLHSLTDKKVWSSAKISMKKRLKKR